MRGLRFILLRKRVPSAPTTAGAAEFLIAHRMKLVDSEGPEQLERGGEEDGAREMHALSTAEQHGVTECSFVEAVLMGLAQVGGSNS